MQIKTFSKKLLVSMDTIRFYEKEGLLQPKRLPNGYRDYDESCEAQLKMIVVLKQLGFSLKEIEQLTLLKSQEITVACNETTVALFDEKSQQLTNKITFYQQAINTLQLITQLMGNQQFEKNQKQIDQSINQLFDQLKEGFHDE
ncbi:MerR family transcriptional regulator [Solibacillus sp. MA9]|uniref:MerR family transcriptional regulator n=1 Tax=Solibacillus palustris TaxID=2908203 RepID=A0ABS9UAX4_9BACL|nr:MerR family transcriptional regulator [Solibacillus sp. MA9]MCH7321496.1 MerR family transcriptional regulator [Solibacillus sp. MA9]